jgi:hypothetical protein
MKTISAFILALSGGLLVGCTSLQQQSEARARATFAQREQEAAARYDDYRKRREEFEADMLRLTETQVRLTMPAEYADGYMDGYRTGRDGLIRKNLTRYLNDAKYHTGWDDGRGAGQEQARSTRKVFGE